MKPNSIGIVGMGLLGRGIAACFLSRGFHVVVHSVGTGWREETQRDIVTAMDDLIAHGCLEAQSRSAWKARYRECESIDEMHGCDFMIESVAEDLVIKRSVLEQIERVVGATVPIATNTSSLSVTQLQHGRVNPQRIIGMHWAPPCHATRFLEIIRGDETNEATERATFELGVAGGKEPALVKKDIPGFIINRIGYAIYREAFHLVESGVADIETIDRVFRQVIGVWAPVAGPFRWMDLTSLVPYASSMGRLFPELSNATQVPPMMQHLIDSGAKGVANGRGFYQYTPEQTREWEDRLLKNVWHLRENVSAGGRQ